MKLSITRNETAVAIDIWFAVLGDEYALRWSHDRGHILDAALLHARLNEQLVAYLRHTRKSAYDDGYRDGRAKRKRCEYFAGWWS